MSSGHIGVGDHLRLRPRLKDAFIFGRVIAIRQDAVILEVTQRNEDLGTLKAGTGVDGVAMAPNEITLFVCGIVHDYRTRVSISHPQVRKTIPLRKTYRKECAIPVSCTLKKRAAAPFPGTVEDVSVHGLRLACETPVETGDHIAIRMALPHDGSEVVETVEVQRVTPPERSRDRMWRAGAAFIGLSRLSCIRLAEYVASCPEQQRGIRTALAA
jgi:hypothetical protein